MQVFNPGLLKQGQGFGRWIGKFALFQINHTVYGENRGVTLACHRVDEIVDQLPDFIGRVLNAGVNMVGLTGPCILMQAKAELQHHTAGRAYLPALQSKFRPSGLKAGNRVRQAANIMIGGYSSDGVGFAFFKHAETDLLAPPFFNGFQIWTG